jgi:glycosyltransferase involved in cell wall biosynthesis
MNKEAPIRLVKRSSSTRAPVLSIIVPVKDEEDAIPLFVERVCSTLEALHDPAGRSFEILFVDDGSSDGTLALLRRAQAADPRIRALSLSRNFGKEAAVSAGLDYARGDAVVPMDVDLQDPPDVLPDMLAKWREGFEVVYGVRQDRQRDSLPKRLTADLFYRAHNRLASDKIPPHVGDFRLLDRKVVDVIRALPERNRFMKGLFAWAGFRQAAVPYSRQPRQAGTTKFSYWKLWTFALDGITSTSTAPLRVWSYIGGLIALLALAYATFIAVRTLVLGIDVPGYASLMVAVLFLGGLQLLSLGIIGEYVGRLMTEAKQRPIYVVREDVGGEL